MSPCSIRLTYRRVRFWFLMTPLLFGLLLIGCRAEESITIQRIPKSESGLQELQGPLPSFTATKTPGSQSPTQSVSQSPQPAEEKKSEPADRMIVGWFDTTDATWFFKLNGTVDAITKAETEWKPFLESVQFVDGKPKYDLPTGWSDAGERPMRFATLKIGDSKPPLELAISSLGPGQDLLLNVNRWRGQMGLASITAENLDADTKPLKLVEKSGAKSALLFDVTGAAVGGGMMPPFANRGASATQSSTHPISDSQLKFDAPDGWSSGQTSGMVPVRLTKTAGEQTAQITVIQMPAAVNEWLPNAKRWAGEVELASLSDEALSKLASNITVDQLEGQLLKLMPDESEKTKATLAGMVKQGETAWFLKLTGDKELVSANEETFSKFLQSLKFPK